MKIRLHSIKLWIAVHALLLFFIRPLQTLITGHSNLIEDLDRGVYIAVWVFTLVALALFLAGLGRIRFPRYHAAEEEKKIGLGRFFTVLAIWFAVWLMLLRSKFSGFDMAALLDSSDEYIHGKSIFLINTVTLLIGFFIVKSYSLRCPAMLRFCIRWFLVVLGLAAGVLSGSKTLALYPCFIILLHRSIVKDGFSAWRIGAIIAFLMPLLALMNIVRHGGVMSIGDALTGAEFFETIIPAVVERFYGVDVIYEIVRHHTLLNKEYFYGQSLMQIVYAFIPSSLWADKPVISFGKIVSEEYLPAVFHGLGISAAPTIIGELFANFSWASVILLPFLGYGFGRHMRNVTSKFNDVSSHYKEYYLIAFTTLAFILEVSIVGWVVQLIASYIGAYLLNALMNFGKTNISKHLASRSEVSPGPV